MGNHLSAIISDDNDEKHKHYAATSGEVQEGTSSGDNPSPSFSLLIDKGPKPSQEVKVGGSQIQMRDDSDSEYGNYVSAEESEMHDDGPSYSGSFVYDHADDDPHHGDGDEIINVENLSISPHPSDSTSPTSNNDAIDFDPYDTDEEEGENYVPFCKENRNFSLPFRGCTSTENFKGNRNEGKDEDGYYSEGDVGRKRPRSTSSKLLFGQGLSLSYPSIAPSYLNLSSADFQYTEDEMLMEGGDLPTPESDLKPQIIKSGENLAVKCRSFHVVTTAALPWMTGTAVNPLLRAVYLNKMNRTAVENALGENNTKRVYDMMGTVTLVVPWVLDGNDQEQLYGGTRFECKHDQEMYIRKWIREAAQMPLEADLDTNGIQIEFYDAHYIAVVKSILPTEYICDQIAAVDADVCILDEPEHLNTLTTHCTEPFNLKFSHVVGIMHTNYVAYLKGDVKSILFAPIAALFCSLITRFHCDRIVKLSGTLQTFAKEKECVMNVHGIRQDFLDEGKRRAEAQVRAQEVGQGHQYLDDDSSEQIYYIGKLLWAKGLHLLLELQSAYKNATGEYFPIDIIGSGPEENEIQRAFQLTRTRSRSRSLSEERDNSNIENGDTSTNSTDASSLSQRSKSVKDQMDKLINDIPRSRFELRKDPIPSNFLGRQDHASLGEKYKILVNPSVTEVLCTTTAEAIAMGKFVIIPMHPSNIFFEQFPNCFLYKTKKEFISHLQYAINNEPQPLSNEDAYILTWEAATERCIDASIVTKREEARRERIGQKHIDLKAAEHSKSRIFDAVRQFLVAKMNEKVAESESSSQVD